MGLSSAILWIKAIGIIFEPWHYRYVGKEAAKEIYEQDITLEEYLGAEPVGSSQAIESDSEEQSL